MKKGIDYPGVTIVFACHDGSGNYLFSKRGQNARDEQGTWDPGGESLEHGEEVYSALKRGIEEEYCARVRMSEFLGFRDVHRKTADGKTHWIALDFKVLIDRRTARNGEPHKFDEVAWFTLDTLPHPMHSQWPTFFKKYKKQLEKV